MHAAGDSGGRLARGQRAAHAPAGLQRRGGALLPPGRRPAAGAPPAAALLRATWSKTAKALVPARALSSRGQRDSLHAHERAAPSATMYRVEETTLIPTLGAPSRPPRCRPAGTPARTARRRRTPPRAAAPARAARTRCRSPTRCAPAPSAPGARARAQACRVAGAAAPGVLTRLRPRASMAKRCSTHVRAPRAARVNQRPSWLRPCH